MKDKHEKRQFLRDLSVFVKSFIDLGQTEATTINEGIKEYYQSQYPDIKEFNTFLGWRKEGFKVKTGSKAFLVWGRPKEIERKKAEEAKAKGEDSDTYDFYPIAYLFANTQVESTRQEDNPKYLNGKSNV